MQKIKDWAAVAAVLLLLPYIVVLFWGGRPESPDNTLARDYTGNCYIIVDNGIVCEKMDLETYVEGAASSVLWADCELEMMKALLILIRTNVVLQMQQLTGGSGQSGALLTVDAARLSEQYTDPNGLKRRMGDSFEAFFRNLARASSETKGWILTYENMPIEAAYHLVSNGKTRRGSDVLEGEYPYLQPVESAGDIYSEDYFMRKEISAKSWQETLETAGYASDAEPEILERDDSGYVKRVSLGDNILSGEEFRRIFKLNSADFSVEEGEKGKIVITKGVGHGLGMSQYGANELAAQGAAFDEILTLYFPETELKKIE